MALADGTNIALVELAIGAELLAVASQTVSRRSTSSGGKSTGKIISPRNDIFAKRLANGAASSQAVTVGLKSYELTPKSTIGPSIDAVNSASMRARTFPATTSC
jgi:hypothetical protein